MVEVQDLERIDFCVSCGGLFAIIRMNKIERQHKYLTLIELYCDHCFNS